MSHHSPTDRLTRTGGTSDRPIYYDDCRGTYHTWYDGGTYEPVAIAVMLGVSSVLGTDPEMLEPLARTVDPEALDDLFTRGNRSRAGAGSLRVSFGYADCTVTIHQGGEIVIEPNRTV